MTSSVTRGLATVYFTQQPYVTLCVYLYTSENGKRFNWLTKGGDDVLVVNRLCIGTVRKTLPPEQNILISSMAYTGDEISASH